MSDPKPAARPTRVTFASVLGTAGCAVLVLSLFDTMQRLQGTDTREELADVLADPPLRGSGVTVDHLLTALRVLGYSAGALAAAGTVLAVFVALRHKQARIGFTIVAGLLLLTMPTTGLLPVLPAVAAGMLWRRDARDWFAGRAPQPKLQPSTPTDPHAPTGSETQPPSVYSAPSQPPTPDASAGTSGAPPASQPFAQPPSERPSSDQPVNPYGQPPGPYGQPPQPYGQAPTQPYSSPYAAQQPWQGGPTTDKRPGTVTTAAVLAMIGAGLGLATGLLVMVALAVAPGSIEDAITQDSQFERLEISVDQVVAILWGTTAVMVLWSLAALVLAVLTLRRNNVARIMLAVSAGMSALLSLLAILSGIAVVTLLLGGASVILLFTGGANDWFARRPRSTGPKVSGSGQPW